MDNALRYSDCHTGMHPCGSYTYCISNTKHMIFSPSLDPSEVMSFMSYLEYLQYSKKLHLFYFSSFLSGTTEAQHTCSDHI